MGRWAEHVQLAKEQVEHGRSSRQERLERSPGSVRKLTLKACAARCQREIVLLRARIACTTPLGASGRRLRVLPPSLGGEGAMLQAFQPICWTLLSATACLPLWPRRTSRACTRTLSRWRWLWVRRRAGRATPPRTCGPRSGLGVPASGVPGGRQRIEIGLIGRTGLVGPQVVPDTETLVRAFLDAAGDRPWKPGFGANVHRCRNSHASPLCLKRASLPVLCVTP